MAKAKSKPTRARVLLRTVVDGVSYAPDDVIELDANEIAALADSGEVDPHPDAIAYAESLKG